MSEGSHGSLGRRASDSVAAAASALPLKDARNSLPTIGAAIDGLRAPVQERGALVVLYLNFDRYAKVEEIYGWEKLDAVLDTTARELVRHLAETPLRAGRLAVAHPNDDDFILLYVPPREPPGREEGDDGDLSGEVAARIGIGDLRLPGKSARRGRRIAVRSVRRTKCRAVRPKSRFERVVYRGIREAAGNARNMEQRSA